MAKTTAPIIATNNSMEATSNGKTNSVNKMVPTSLTVPKDSGGMAGELKSPALIMSIIFYKTPVAKRTPKTFNRMFLSLLCHFSFSPLPFKLRSMMTNMNKTMIAPA